MKTGTMIPSVMQGKGKSILKNPGKDGKPLRVNDKMVDNWDDWVKRGYIKEDESEADENPEADEAKEAFGKKYTNAELEAILEKGEFDPPSSWNKSELVDKIFELGLNEQ